MSDEPPIPRELWDKTQPEVQAAVLALVQSFERRIAALEARLGQDVTVGEKSWRGSAEDRGTRTSEVTTRSPRRRCPGPAGRAACGGGRRVGDSSPSPSPRSCS